MTTKLAAHPIEAFDDALVALENAMSAVTEASRALRSVPIARNAAELFEPLQALRDATSDAGARFARSLLNADLPRLAVVRPTQLLSSESQSTMISLNSNTPGLATIELALYGLDLRSPGSSSSPAFRKVGAASGRFLLDVERLDGPATLVVTIQASADGSTGWSTVGTFTSRTTPGQESISVPTGAYIRATYAITGTNALGAKFQVLAELS
jgi:hypothetical protein